MKIDLAVRWRLAVMLCLITTINYLDRQAFAVAGPVLVDEFSLTNTEFGTISSAFLLAYAIGQFVVGPLVDLAGSKRAFSIAVVAWSIAGMLCAAARGFWSFLGLRALLGIAEAANFPAALKVIAEWFPREDRSLAVGIVTVGPGLGAVISPPLLGWLIVSFGWPWAFLVPGAIGFIWLIFWVRWFESPESHPGLDAAERKLILTRRDDQGADDAQPWHAVFRFLRIKEVWGLMLSRLVSDGAFYFFVAWLPLYLSQERGFDIAQIALFAWVPFLAADLGSLAGGWAGKMLMERGMSVDRARKIVIWFGALLVPVALPAVVSDSPYTALILIGIAMFAIQVKAASLFTVPADLFPARDVATIWGMFGAVGSIGGAVFVSAVGWITSEWSYYPVFVAVALMHIVSAAIVMILIPNIRPIGTLDLTGQPT